MTSRWRTPFDWLRLYQRARAAERYAASTRLPGLEFARFGRNMGWRLLQHGHRTGARYVLTPVNSFRYFEFAFALECLPEASGRYLDVSSPRLFSLYTAFHRPGCQVSLLNPDLTDTATTQTIVTKLGLRNVHVQPSAVDILATSEAMYDCIWSLSVIEHIAGAYEDSDALRWMYAALKPGGRLVVTVPIDRRYWIEYRDLDHYGTQSRTSNDQYFFQRFYDLPAVTERLSCAIQREPVLTRWFGEKTSGHFQAYVARWLREGEACTVDDPREMADYYQAFETWEAMPGMGVVGLLFEKPC